MILILAAAIICPELGNLSRKLLDLTFAGNGKLHRTCFVEFKIGKRRPDLMKKAEEALQQIVEKRYDTPFIEEEYEQCIHVGIGFVRKMCRVKCETVRYEL